MTDDSTDASEPRMDHPRIEQEQVIERYLASRLSPDEEEQFEEHLFACAECLEQVEAGEEMRRGLRTVATETARAAVASTVVSAELASWFRALGPLRRTLLAAAVVAWALGPAWLLWRTTMLRSSATAAALSQPFGDLQLVSLGPTRDVGAPQTLSLDPRRRAVVLSLELSQPTADHYHATLRAVGAATPLWQGGGLTPSLYDSLLVVVPRALLPPGRYQVEVTAEDGGGAAATFVFQIADGTR